MSKSRNLGTRIGIHDLETNKKLGKGSSTQKARIHIILWFLKASTHFRNSVKIEDFPEDESKQGQGNKQMAKT